MLYTGKRYAYIYINIYQRYTRDVRLYLISYSFLHIVSHLLSLSLSETIIINTVGHFCFFISPLFFLSLLSPFLHLSFSYLSLIFLLSFSYLSLIFLFPFNFSFSFLLLSFHFSFSFLSLLSLFFLSFYLLFLLLFDCVYV